MPRDADEAALEACRLAVEDELNAISRAADQRVATPPIEPAALAEGAV